MIQNTNRTSGEKKKSALEVLKNYSGPEVKIMEVCGTHTHEIFRLGIRKILPPNIRLISGPGCPVCVTPVSYIDEALMLALEHGCTICTFGDLVRVPGTESSLQGPGRLFACGRRRVCGQSSRGAGGLFVSGI